MNTKNEKALMTYTDDKIELIKNTVAAGATDDELKLFLYQCQRTGLDALARQLYFVKRGGKTTIQTSIDGLRVVAERSGEYEGQTIPEWCGEDGKWLDVWLKTEPPAAARIGVYRKNFKEPLYGVAKWKSYVPVAGQDFMWRRMPEVMLSKVAEALALRKAFPQDLSGIYSSDEMEQAEDVKADKTEKREEQQEIDMPIEKPTKITTFQINKILQLGKDLGNSEEETTKKITNAYKIRLLGELNQDIAAQVIENMMKRKKERKMMSSEESDELVNEVDSGLDF